MVGTAFSGNRQPKEHGLLLYLSPELQLAVCKLQFTKELGRSYAGLLALTEGLHRLRCLSDSAYEKLKNRYSERLALTEQKPEPKTAEEIQAKRHRDLLEAQFSEVIQRWPTLKPSARAIWLRRAEENLGHIPNAKLLLDLAPSVNAASGQVVEAQSSNGEAQA